MSRFGSITSSDSINTNVMSSPTPGATINLDASTAVLFKWTAGQNETVNVTAGQETGRIITLQIANDATPRTITFGTGTSAGGVIIGTSLTTSTIVLQSDGTTFYELTRKLALV